ALQSHPELSLLDFNGPNLFIHYASLARESIEFEQADKSQCPAKLPINILRILVTALGEKDTYLVGTCWAAFRQLVWNQPPIYASFEEILAYNDASLRHGTSYRHLYPPVRSCQDREC
ncbi:hypothetical protein DFH09DRAFT_870354, partial [Mycena vulgaris]